MKILISNDDGYRASGIRCLRDVLSRHYAVTVVAPEQDRSGASNSLTLVNPLRARKAEEGVIAVDGTPTDCVHLALTGLIDDEPDIVVSGINAGANLGDDVLYSGTVAAAMEGRHLGHPAIAVSLVLDGGKHYETAALVIRNLLRNFSQHSIPGGTILNINVPDRPLEDLCGFAVTRLGQRHKSEAVIADRDPRGREIYWLGPPGSEQDAGPGTDFFAVRQGQVSITPLHIDVTRYSAMDMTRDWLMSIGLSVEMERN